MTLSRIGVFVCECGSNIKDKVNIPQVLEALMDMEEVVTVEPYRLLCSSDGKSYLDERIRMEKLTHVVIAACSPRDHQQTFMTVCETAGLNPYLMQLVNIREQCAWVTEDPSGATEKAIRMIRAAVRRVRYQAPLSKRELVMNPDVLVLGGGVAGIEACSSLSSPGRRVYLVERNVHLGGTAASLQGMLPEKGDIRHHLEVKISDLMMDKGVEVLTDHRLESVVGYYGNFEVKVTPNAGQGTPRDLKVGALVLATGAQLFDPAKMSGYGSGKVEDVITSLQLEERSRSGIIALANGSLPRSVAMVHCVGREVKGYCSKVCCSYGVKLSYNLKQMLPDINIIHLFSDLCIPGKRAQAFFEETISKGVEMVRASQILVYQGTVGPKVDFMDEGGAARSLGVDMVVLLSALEPNAGAQGLAELLDISQDRNGFFSRKHENLGAMASDREGVFIAGCADGPKGIKESEVQAQAATGAILASLIPGKRMDVEVKTSHIEDAICQGCKTCIAVCPFGAITFDAQRKIAVVNEVMCRGCGSCVAACPSGAATVKHFTYDQIYQEIVEALR
jgi:heterodisulfide reductase subunit A